MVGIMYGVLVLWTVILVVFLGALVKRYTLFDPGTWTRETHPFAAETLAMSRGGLDQHIEQLLTAFQMMLAFYFGGKVMHHLAAVDKRKEQSRQQTERLALTSAPGAPPGAGREFRAPAARLP